MTVAHLFAPTAGPAVSAVNSSPFTFGLQFTVAEDCLVTAVLCWSAADALSLPTSGAIYDVATQAQVPNTLTAFPATGLGTGWLRAALATPQRLKAGRAYKSCVLVTGGSNKQIAYTPGVFSFSDHTVGVLTAPADANSSPGQCSYSTGSTSLVYPATGAGGTQYWVDVEVNTFPPPGPSRRGLMLGS